MGACSGRLGREAGGVHKLEVEMGGLRGESLVGKIKVGDEVGGGGEGGVLPRQPDLVGAIPGQRVQVAHEN